MGTYKLKIATGTDLSAGTCDQVSIVFVGVLGESAKHHLNHKWSNFRPGAVTDFTFKSKTKTKVASKIYTTVCCQWRIATDQYALREFVPEIGALLMTLKSTLRDLGELLLIRLSTMTYKGFNAVAWYCQYVNVTCPNGRCYQFPFYQWLPSGMTVEIPEGKGIILSGNTHPILQQQRRSELEKERETHKWKCYVEGVPHCIDVDKVEDLPGDDRYTFLKLSSLNYSKTTTGLAMMQEGSTGAESWTDLDDIKLVFCLRGFDNSDVVAEIWKEDYFFGSQYLNGINPTQIKKCSKILENFPVSDNMVAASLGTTTSLQQELKKGNIFLADYKILQGIPANKSINGKQQYIAAPICLLWKTHQDQLIPIAIQLAQTPGESTPIFLPSDSEYDWLLAKIWVRNSDYQVHQVDIHFLRTHLFAEVFNIATTRQLPMSHPVYKLLIPHLRYTLEINVRARSLLIGPRGLFDQAASTGNGGVPILLRKAMDEVTYRSLCLPDDIQARGVESIPNYLYRDDGMEIWLAVESFVSNIVNYYYECDAVVGTDPELQAWMAEISKEGFLESNSTGMPSSLKTKACLIKYLTMVIFTCSAQHAAVNSFQSDFYTWMPNGPPSMRSPPATVKGVSTIQSILAALPEVNTTSLGISTVWLLSKEPLDRRCLGDYPNVRFTEEVPQTFIKNFQEKLAKISHSIKGRNKSMNLPYPYLDPSVIENSVSV
ncbi:polyunsaturated fatty acid lipoxygenase ALOX15B-like [Pseudophryne corroboree]|uniref:polyunsaturated fatty acid lipoxygenase ALOX15B-like n=1 Tax=Pseudophryne corroboree TaxID=495146 RepID=UPI0030819551